MIREFSRRLEGMNIWFGTDGDDLVRIKLRVVSIRDPMLAGIVRTMDIDV